MTDWQIGARNYRWVRPLGVDQGAPSGDQLVPIGVLHAVDPATKTAACGVALKHSEGRWPPGVGDTCDECAAVTGAG